MTTVSTTRVFFALWPPASVAREIHAQAAALAIDGRRVTRDRLHLTLAFHGRSDNSAVQRLQRAADALVMPAFNLVLDRIGHFRRPGMTWFGPGVTPAPLMELAAALAPSSQDAPVGNRFSPHVSVARESAALTAAPIPPIVWPVDCFALIASGQNGAPGAYRKLAQWPLKTESVWRAW